MIASNGVNLFYSLSIAGLAFVFGIQSLIHISSNIGIIPTKGMTLPFLSYGGSSTFSSALLICFLMSLTKKELNFKHFDVKI